MYFSTPNKLASFEWYEALSGKSIVLSSPKNVTSIIRYSDVYSTNASSLGLISSIPSGIEDYKYVTESYIENLFNKISIVVNGVVDSTNGTYKLIATHPTKTNANGSFTLGALTDITLSVNCGITYKTSSTATSTVSKNVTNTFTIYSGSSSETFYGSQANITNLTINSIVITPKCYITRGNSQKTHLYIPIIGNVSKTAYSYDCNISNISITPNSNNSLNIGATNTWTVQFRIDSFKQISNSGTETTIQVAPGNITFSAKGNSETNNIPTVVRNSISSTSTSSFYTISVTVQSVNVSDVPEMPTLYAHIYVNGNPIITKFICGCNII